MKFNPTILELFVLILACVQVYLCSKYHKRIVRWWRERRKRRRGARQLRPRDPSACPQCVGAVSWLVRKPTADVTPWREVKGRAGRPKTVDTSGYACLNVACEYYGITDAAVHALVSDGQRNGVQYWRCQACGGRKSSRMGTPLYQLKTPVPRVVMVMTALVEGVDIAAATRIFDHHHTTIQRWIERAGQHSARLHNRLLDQAVIAGHVQLDELVTRVKRDQERVWIWTAIDAHSKVILALHVGRRAIEDACALFHQVKQRLKPGCFPVYTSDGLNQYHYGLTAHYGHWEKPPRARKWHWLADARLQYAQLRKRRRGRKVEFLYSIIRLGEREIIRTMLRKLGFTGRVQTAYVERANLTLREHIAPLSRRTWSLAYDRYHLWLHIQWGLAYYHLVRPHRSLRVHVRGPSQRRDRTPAMAAGLTSKRWTVTELLHLPVPEYGEVTPFPVV